MTGFVALLRRELWEHRSILIVPAALAFLILGTLFGTATWALVRHGTEVDVSAHFRSGLEASAAAWYIPQMYVGLVIFFGVVLAISIPLYLIDCLYADRRDRSILFWKSLPISDVATVLSKLTTGLLVAPAAALAAAFATALILGVAGTIVLWASGVEHVSWLWQLRPLLTIFFVVPAVALLIALWYAPVAAWCMLASAWAPRAPMLWATLPPVALIILEQVAFRTYRVPQFLGDRLGGVFPRLFDTRDYVGFGVHEDGFVGSLPALRDVVGYLTSLDLWGGLAVAAVFAAVAIALRRYRDET